MKSCQWLMNRIHIQSNSALHSFEQQPVITVCKLDVIVQRTPDIIWRHKFTPGKYWNEVWPDIAKEISFLPSNVMHVELEVIFFDYSIVVHCQKMLLCDIQEFRCMWSLNAHVVHADATTFVVQYQSPDKADSFIYYNWAIEKVKQSFGCSNI